MTKEDLMPLAKTYFDSDPKRTEIYGTEDRHFFNTKSDVEYYCKTDKKYFYFQKIDFEKKSEIKDIKNVIEVPKKAESKEEKPVKKVTIKK